MDPFDPVRNEESSGYSKRRTSILKMPRKSISVEVEQQENVVECAKSSDKRISRRVSFAPANDVLLFSKEAKNPSPLQLSAGSATQNRDQMKVTEDQQFTGIDTLLKAPKQILQQKDMPSIYSEMNYGEKTMIFSADDLNMTQCHTVRITNDAEFLDTSHGLLHGHGDRTVMFDRSMDMTLSQTLNMICDQDLSFSSKPTTPRAFPFTSQMTPVAQVFSYNTDKENHVPKLSKSIIKKMGESNVSFKDDMGMPEDDPLQCLFPQEIYAQPEKLKSQTTSTDRKLTSEPTENDSKRRLTDNFNSKNNVRNEKTIVFSDGGFMDITQNYTSNIVVASSASSALGPTGLKERKRITPGLSALASEGCDEPLQCRFPLQQGALHKDSKLHRESSHKGLETTLKTLNMPGHQIMIGSEEESQEKTVRFSTDEACMDVTRSHTIRISSDLHLQRELESFPLGGEKTVRFSTHDAGMDMTQCLTVNIARDLLPNSTSGPKQEAVTALPAQSVDLEFENFFASLSGQNPKEKMQNNASLIASEITRTPFENVCTGADDTVNMDITEAQTGRISGDENLYHNVVQTGKKHQPQRRVLGTLPIKGTESSQKSQIQRLSAAFDAEEPCRERTVRFAADEALMDVTSCHTVHISTDFKPDPPCSEKTIRFDVNDAAMDVTQCHTVNIAKDFDPSLHDDNLGLLPKYGEKTVRSSADNATMDMTRSQTVNIGLEPNESFNNFPKYGEKTVQFNADDATMDMTRSQTVNIGFEPNERFKNLPKYGEKTVQFNADDATMDMTRSQTVNIGFEPNERFKNLPKYGEKTERINAAMDETQCLTVNIATEMRPKPKSCLSVTQMCAADPEPRADQNSSPTSGEKTLRFSVDDANTDVTKSHTMVMDVVPQVIQGWDTLAQNEERTGQFSSDEGGIEVTQCLTSNIGVETEASCSNLSPVPSSITTDAPPALKKREPIIYSNRRCKSLNRQGLNLALNARRSVPWSYPLNEATPTSGTDDEDFVKPTKTGAHNGNIGVLSMIEEKSVAEVSLKQKCLDNSMEINMTEALPVQIQRNSILESPLKDLAPSAEEQTTEDPASKCELELKIHPGSPQTNMKNDHEQEVEGKSDCSPTSMEKDKETNYSRKSRRMSLADIHSKIRRISQKLNAPSEDDVVDNVNIPTPFTDPQPKLEADKPTLLQADEPDVDLVKNENKSDALDEPFCAPTTPFKLETKQLMSRLSVVGFKPKLTKRSKSEEIKTDDGSVIQPAGKCTKTQNIQTGNFDLNVSDINDEELGSYEDVSESLDKESEIVTSFHDFELDQELQDEVFEEEFTLVNEKKRPLPDEECITEDEKRLKRSNDTVILDSQTSTLECDDNVTTAASTQTTNSSNSSHTANLKYDSTFESTSKQSLYESQLEDYTNSIQRKYDEGTLTMMDFLKLFHIDFVIHNSRQSVAPGRVSSDAESTLVDLSYDRHISLPKQLVYEANVRNLTEQVEGLKVRMQDLEKPLMLVNKTLWEEIEHFTEPELKSFGAKLKERHNFYRKMSKAKSHEMKEALYAALIQANVEEQKKLSGSIEKADAMLKSLDDCIADLEADLATTESDVKSHQEELNNVKEATSNNERSLSELEIQKKQSLNKLKRVKNETKNLDRHLAMLHTINEWKLVEITTKNSVYTFLYGTLHLELVFEELEGNDEDRKIVDISFKHLLDENSQCHARLVHTLIAQFTQDKSLTKNYPTSKHVPELLHDVSLVVSRCRQLGEELRRLRAWGSLRLDILDIHCLHSEIYITFSSLRRFRKFEVVFSVGLNNKHCALQLKSFKNLIGDTTSQNIEEIVASFTPGQKYLTGIIKTIHCSLLC